MRALRIAGQATVHSTSRHVDFYFYAYTDCNLRADWKDTVRMSVTLDPDDDRLVIAEPVDEPVDCMTCLVRMARMAREEDKADKPTNTNPNPSAEIKL